MTISEDTAVDVDFDSIGRFRVGKCLGWGEQAVVYEATLVSEPASEVKLRTLVPNAVVKIPLHTRFKTGRPSHRHTPDSHRRWREAQGKRYDWEVKHWLRQKSERIGEKRTLDETTIAEELGFALSIATTSIPRRFCLVDETIPQDISHFPCALQPFIDSKCLKDEIDKLRVEFLQGSSDGFCEVYWELVKRLSTALSNIHVRGLVHADVRTCNVLLTAPLPKFLEQDKWLNSAREHVEFPKPVLVDFGSGWERSRPSPLQDADRAPEDHFEQRDDEHFTSPSRLEAQGDIYMLGRLLLRMAIGEEPLDWAKRQEFASLINNEVPDKPYIKHLLKSRNPRLYDFNIGIADVIARCVWIPAEDGRYTRVSQVSRDLSLFSECKNPSFTFSDSLDSLQEVFCGSHSVLIKSMIDFRLAQAYEELREWRDGGIAEFYGGHHEVIALRSHIFGVLGPGDVYLSVSPRRFWSKSSNGLDGRMLASQVLAAEAGVTIRRIHLENVPNSVSDEQDLDKILEFQSEYSYFLEAKGFNVRKPELEHRGFYTGRMEFDKAVRTLRSSNFLGRGSLTLDYEELPASELYKALVIVQNDGGGRRKFYRVESRYARIRSTLSSVSGEEAPSFGNRLIGFQIIDEDPEVAQNFVSAYEELLCSPHCRSILVSR